MKEDFVVENCPIATANQKNIHLHHAISAISAHETLINQNIIMPAWKK
jgi:hypothetical protein